MEAIKTPKEMVRRAARQRTPYSIPVTLHELSVSGLIVKNSRIVARVEDFSHLGMRVSSPARLMTFTSVLCELPAEGTQVGATTIAQVRWVQKAPSGDYSIGLQYQS